MGVVERGKRWGLRLGVALLMVTSAYTIMMKSGQYYKRSGGSSHSLATERLGSEPTREAAEAKTSMVSSAHFSSMTTNPTLGAKFTPLQKKDIEDVKTFVIFVGHSRSGHSIVGALMDAHPDMILAHEYNVLSNITKDLASETDTLALFNSLYRNSYNSAVNGWRSAKETRKGYNLSMSHNSWQGRVRRLKVVGDKGAAMTVAEHKRDPTKCPYLVSNLQSALKIPVKAIHVLRNPYDNIATQFLYFSHDKNNYKLPRSSSEVASFKKPQVATKTINYFFGHASAVRRMIDQCHLRVLNVHLSDLIKQPASVIRVICKFVGVECSAEYLESCAGKVFKSLSKPRSLVEWSQKQIDVVAWNIMRFQEYSRYSYKCDC
jgi:hypothetical protein